MSQVLEEPRLCVMGASPDTGNLGVSALSESIVAGIARLHPRSKLTLFDNGLGTRRDAKEVDGRRFPYALCGLRRSRRYYLRESMLNVRLSVRLGGLGNAAACSIRGADMVLAANGGDSFSDIYGEERFKAIVGAKEIALSQNRPLVLLPQTYGPFSSRRCRSRAERILRSTTAAWARDAESFEILEGLLGADFDATRHRLGVDLAFGLDPSPPAGRELDVAAIGAGAPVAGVNVSGLIFNDSSAAGRFGLSLDYRATLRGLVRRLVAEGAQVLLVPHVHAGSDERFSDWRACRSLLGELDQVERERVAIAPNDLTAGEAKWLIGRCDWFCGTRMHSAIAAISSGVPTAAIAYSLKTAGVFAGCGQRSRVVDGRRASTEQAAERLWAAWLERDRVRDELEPIAQRAVRDAKAQWADILASPVA